MEVPFIRSSGVVNQLAVSVAWRGAVCIASIFPPCLVVSLAPNGNLSLVTSANIFSITTTSDDEREVISAGCLFVDFV